jgi:hypothetical protein
VIHPIATGDADAIDKKMRYGLMPLTASNLTRLVKKQLLYHACFEVEKKKRVNSKCWIHKILRETVWRWIEIDGKTSQNGPCGINS